MMPPAIVLSNKQKKKALRKRNPNTNPSQMTVWKQLQGAYTIDLAERMFAGINYWFVLPRPSLRTPVCFCN
jgi:hypothetical protein